MSIAVMSLRARTACLAMLLLSGTRVSAQLPKCSNSGRAVAQPCELDQWPLSITRDQRPRYPAILRQAGVEGEVLVRYVIDTSGSAVRDSVKVIRSSHDLFMTAVKNAIPLLRFAAPRRAGVAVNVEVEEVVKFDHTEFQNTAVRPAQLSQRTADSTGRLLTTVYALLPRDSLNAPVLTRPDSLEIYEAVVEELMRQPVVRAPPPAW